VRLSLPVIQTRDLAPGETVGYGCSFTANARRKSQRYPPVTPTGSSAPCPPTARRSGPGDTPCPLAGRVSMDLLTVDVTDLAHVPDTLDILGPHQTVDDLADAAGTIGYEILTSLGPRYSRAEARA
jgi:alanine racemase